MVRRQKLIVSLLITCICLLFMSVSVQGQNDEEMSKKVLFISSYNAGFDTLPSQIDGLRSVFDGTKVTLDIDYMDTRQHNFDENYENYYRFLKGRLDNGIQYDVVIVGDDNGLQFLMDNKQLLFPDVAIVFFCINDFERAEFANSMDKMVGVVEAISLDSNIKLAVDLFPEATEIIAIVDNTKTGIGDSEAFLDVAERYPNLKFSLLNSSEYTFEEFEKMLRNVSRETVLFYLSMFEDKLGENKSIEEAAKMISVNSNVPVFRMSIGGVGDGLLGGNMVSYEEQGRLAAKMTISILNGADPDSIQMVSESPNQYYFDYNIMRNFGLTLKDVPEGSIIINEPKNFFKDNKEILIPGTFIFLVLCMFILILVRDNRKLKAKDKELKENNMELSAMYEEIIATEEELRNQYDKLNESEERYRKLAYTDTLTELNNRFALMGFLDEFLEKDIHKGYLLYIDMDNFKYINDTRGHEIGDLILKQISIRFLEFEGAMIYLSRLGGDEFVAVIGEMDCGLDDFIHKLSMRMQECIVIGTAEFYLSCSIGIAVFPKDGQNKNILLRKADMAMYRAKTLGRSRFIYYDENMDLEMGEKLLVQNKLRNALNNDELELFFQPQCDLNSGVMCGIEALIRWKDSNGKFISPEFFIPAAEEQGLIHLIGKWVYEEAASKAKQWEQRYGKSLFYAVNASAVELIGDNFANNFIAILDHHGISHDQVALEITESILIDDKERSIRQIQILKDNGVEIHLDDFGTGYSSLNYLQRLPLDVIKIDREFIKNLSINDQYKDMTQFIIDIAHRLGLKVIAEGVETSEQYSQLKQMGCDKVQGYYYAKPMSYDNLCNFTQYE